MGGSLIVDGHELCDPRATIAKFGLRAARLNNRNADPGGCNYLRDGLDEPLNSGRDCGRLRNSSDARRAWKAATEISSWPVYRYPSLGLTHIDQVGRGDGRKFHLLRLRAVRLVRGSKRQFHLVRQNPSKRGGAKYSALAIQTCPTGADFEQLTDLFG
jgi:hypothetical protein